MVVTHRSEPELCGHDKKKKDFHNPLDIKVIFWKIRNLKNKNFCFYGPNGTGPEL